MITTTQSAGGLGESALPAISSSTRPAWFSRPRTALYDLYCELRDMSALDLGARLTLVLLILYSGEYWYLKAPMAIVCTCGVVFRQLFRTSTFWLLIALVLVWGNLLNWYTIDNHKYLMTYWTLALYCCLRLPKPQEALAWNARTLIGLCFAFSVLWKCISGDFLNGGFFHLTILDDNRFHGVATALGGTQLADFRHNSAKLAELVRFDSSLSDVVLREGARVPLIALILTWWTMAIETLIAAAFLVPTTWKLSRYRHVFLILFALTTYWVAPVIGFGWLLLVMGVTQCDASWPKTRALYVVTFFALQISTNTSKYVFDGLQHLIGSA